MKLFTLNGNRKIRVWIIYALLVCALSASASAALNHTVYVTYKTADGSVISTNTSSVNTALNITLPNTTLLIEFEDHDRTFKLQIPLMNISNVTILNVSGRAINISSVTYSGDFGITNLTKDFIVRDAYAFRVIQDLNKSYNLSFNTSGLSMVKPVIFKTAFNFTINESSTANASQLTTTFDSTSQIAFVSVTGFSSFFLTEDHCNNGVTDYSEDGLDCGGSCSVCAAGGSGGGGGTPQVAVIVTPTTQAVTVQAASNEVIEIVYNGVPYTYSVTSLIPGITMLKSLKTFRTHLLLKSLPALFDLDDNGFSDIEVIFQGMEGSRGLFTITLQGTGQHPFVPPTPRPRTTELEAAVSQIPQAPAVPPSGIPVTSPEVALTPTPEAPQPSPPAAPITVWTWVLAVVFITVLVGGVAFARYRHFSLDKPPSGIRTGLDLTSETGLPQASSEVTKPALSSFERQLTTLPHAEQRLTQAIPEEKKKVIISEAKRLELQRYIYHALGNGFEESTIRDVLVDRGWPKVVIDGEFEKLLHLDKKAEKEDLGSQQIQLTRAMDAIKRLRTQGMSKEEISAALVRKGWKPEVVDQLMKNVP